MKGTLLRWIRGAGHRLRALTRRNEWEEGLREEMRFHLDMETEKLIREGMSPWEARRTARIRMGGEERMKERAREERGTLFWDRTWQDIDYGVRTLLRAPAFTAVAVSTLALGIGANTALFSLVDGILLRPLPYPEPEELFFLEERSDEGVVRSGSIENFRDFRRRARAVEALAVMNYPVEETVRGLSEPTRVPVMGVARDFFSVAGVRPAVGRALDPAQGRVGGQPEVVVSHSFWTTFLDGDPELGRRPLSILGNRATVVGVMPPGFQLLGDADVWYHLEQEPSLPNHRGSVGWRVVGRLADGVTLEEAEGEMDVIARRISREYGDQTDITGVELTPLKKVVVGDVQRALWILLAASAFVLLVACTNLAATALARGTAREGEIAVRTALGAGRGRLLRQLFTESLLLAGAGAVAGLALAWLGVRGVELMAPEVLPRGGASGLDWRVLAYATLVALAASVLFGILPALGLLGGDRSTMLRAGAHRSDRGFSQGPWGALVAAEVALAVVLLVGSGLLIRTLWSIVSVDPGFRTEGVVTADIDLPRDLYQEPGASVEFYQRLTERLHGSPGVQEAGAVLLLPTYASSLVSSIQKEKGTGEDGSRANYRIVHGDYFETLGIPLRRGRLFRDSDGPDAPHVAVVNESMARTFWPGQDALGRRFHLGGMDPYRDDWITVVGVVGEARRWNRAAGEQPAYYLSHRQRPYFGWFFGMTVVLRGDAPPDQLAAAARAAVREMDAQVPVEIEMLDDRVASTWSDRRFNAALLGGFALVGLLLAGVGIYGVVSYSVERRRREAGIRIALGAPPSEVAGLIRGQAMTRVAVGMVVGVFGALALSRTLSSLLFGVSPLDPWAFAGGAGLLLAVSWMAAALPAHRSTRVDPLVAMRTE